MRARKSSIVSFNPVVRELLVASLSFARVISGRRRRGRLEVANFISRFGIYQLLHSASQL